jgi:hypothetical protein
MQYFSQQRCPNANSQKRSRCSHAALGVLISKCLLWKPDWHVTVFEIQSKNSRISQNNVCSRLVRKLLSTTPKAKLPDVQRECLLPRALQPHADEAQIKTPDCPKTVVQETEQPLPSLDQNQRQYANVLVSANRRMEK